MIKSITSRENALVKKAHYLKTSKGRKEHQQFLSEGKKSLELALKSNLVTDVFTLEELSDIPSNVNQYLVTPEIIDKIAFTTNPEGVVFIANFLPMVAPKEIRRALYLDAISDPGNMGTIIRTALALDYDAVILGEECASIYNEKVISASKGSIFLLPIFEGDLHDYQESHTIIASALSEKAKILDEVTVKEPFILVLGNEAHGIRGRVRKLAHVVVKIPMKDIDSLNVSVAAGILMYHFKK
ncbi:MAG: RNA methyltransferase [Erysipelotrichaceae bacterium]|jgi:TrmH family RNA methyltransferase|nr:RNA methyltransferase [Erysipelotrichaceae bacterium]HPY79616.1 RNA methyltransferase [Bacilli bacterium]HQA55909.1 RNA methyltransferase [Bacilli bacterium]